MTSRTPFSLPVETAQVSGSLRNPVPMLCSDLARVAGFRGTPNTLADMTKGLLLHASFNPEHHDRSPGIFSAGDQLVLRCFGPKAPPAEVLLPFRFAPRVWHHVVIAHAPGGPLSAPLATLFVDGSLAAVAEKLRYPKVGFGLLSLVPQRQSAKPPTDPNSDRAGLCTCGQVRLVCARAHHDAHRLRRLSPSLLVSFPSSLRARDRRRRRA